MARSSTQQKKLKSKGKPGRPKKETGSFVERALNGMTERLEAGTSLSDREVPLYLMMLHAFNSREMLNYLDLFNKMDDRITSVEARLNTQQNLRQVMDTSKRVPPQEYGPPNQSPFPSR